jgi:hypothetical protein
MIGKTPPSLNQGAPMQLDVNIKFVNSPFGSEVPEWAKLILHKLDLATSERELIMSAESDALDQAEAAARANSEADASAEALLQKIASMVKDLSTNQTDPSTTVRINALSDMLNARAKQLSDAVVAATDSMPHPDIGGPGDQPVVNPEGRK